MKCYFWFAFKVVFLAVAGLGCENDNSENGDTESHSDDLSYCNANNSWRCKNEVEERCQDGWWRPWENCAWNGGECVEEAEGVAGCVPPDSTEVPCHDSQGDICMMCKPDPPETNEDFPKPAVGCCSPRGSVFWATHSVVEKKCPNGCCALIDSENRLLRHRCCE